MGTKVKKPKGPTISDYKTQNEQLLRRIDELQRPVETCNQATVCERPPEPRAVALTQEILNQNHHLNELTNDLARHRAIVHDLELHIATVKLNLAENRKFLGQELESHVPLV